MSNSPIKFRSSHFDSRVCCHCLRSEYHHGPNWECANGDLTIPQPLSESTEVLAQSHLEAHSMKKNRIISSSELNKAISEIWERNGKILNQPELGKPPEAKKTQEGGDHYLKMGVQPWDVIDTWSQEQKIGYFRGNALKYIMRLGSKDESVKEAKKVKHYIEKLIETLENDN